MKSKKANARHAGSNRDLTNELTMKSIPNLGEINFKGEINCE